MASTPQTPTHPTNPPTADKKGPHRTKGGNPNDIRNYTLALIPDTARPTTPHGTPPPNPSMIRTHLQQRPARATSATSIPCTNPNQSSDTELQSRGQHARANRDRRDPRRATMDMGVNNVETLTGNTSIL
ncbi:Hypothetical predicted protein [Pelobates cultripes]|uniref:Uncharacterized protein n=1 Tax=Pelobates cultripes TaxID=61616 RepID=A0AAD1SB64_PELCU|nr:Hypothetical predicted protein [Pelobates cultripes]